MSRRPLRRQAATPRKTAQGLARSAAMPSWPYQLFVQQQSDLAGNNAGNDSIPFFARMHGIPEERV